MGVPKHRNLRGSNIINMILISPTRDILLTTMRKGNPMCHTGNHLGNHIMISRKTEDLMVMVAAPHNMVCHQTKVIGVLEYRIIEGMGIEASRVVINMGGVINLTMSLTIGVDNKMTNTHMFIRGIMVTSMERPIEEASVNPNIGTRVIFPSRMMIPDGVELIIHLNLSG